MSAGGGPSKELVPAFVEAGAVVIDNSSTWRMCEDVPLVVPEVNPGDIGAYKSRGIIANPNCSTIQLVVALKPISTEFGWPRSALSIAYAAQYFGAGVGGVAMGFWLDRSGMAKPAMLGAIMIGLGAVATSYAHEAWHFWLIYGLMMVQEKIREKLSE